jgi:hypothetical protein
VLWGQHIAGDTLDRCRPMSELAGDDLAAAARAVLAGVLGEWNGAAAGLSSPVTVASLLRTELRVTFGSGGWVRRWAEAAGLLDPAAVWLETAEDGVMPNPVLMATETSVGESYRLRYLHGHSHGDLHHDNVLIPRARDGVLEPRSFRLIDLATFDHVAPLSRDPAMLLVAVLSRVGGELSATQQDALLRYVVRGDAAVRPDLPQRLVDQVDALRDASAAPFVGRGFSDDWDLQLLVSVQAAALLHSTYESLGEAGRWWCFRLAGRVGRHVLERFGRQLPSRGDRRVGREVVAEELVARRAGGSSAASGPTEPRPARVNPGAPPVLSFSDREAIVNALLNVPGMKDPDFRGRLYEDLPSAVVEQIQRDRAARLEVFGLVRVLDEYRSLNTWSILVHVLGALVSQHPSVEVLAELLRGCARVEL